jgi:hypothetical protein
MSSCNICTEKFNKTARACVKCICDFESCRTCIKTYLLDKSEDPHCMSCKISWDRKFMCDNFEKNFISKTYKNHRENVLMEREMGMLQATQVYVEREIKMEKLQVAMIQLRNRFHEEMNALQNALNEHLNCITVEKKKFVRKCPNGDCHGFLSSSLKCEICDCWACGDCHEIKGYTPEEKEQHTCNPEIVESVKFLAKDSKPCPKCASLTFKIIGCFAKDTPIIMWDQTIKMSQDIKIGDILIGDDGEQRTVLTTCSGEDEMYEITQTKGENYIVNSKHTLVLKFTTDKSIVWCESINRWKVSWFCRETLKMKTKDFIVKNDITKEMAKQEADNFKNTLNFSKEIEMRVDQFIKLTTSAKKQLLGFKSSKSINYNEKEVTLDPYMLGLWLGDGTHTEPVIASGDIEIQNYILNWCENNDAELVHEEGVKFRIRRRGLSNYKGNNRLAISKGATSDSCKGCITGIEDIVRKFDICDTPYIENNSEFTKMKTNPFTDQIRKYNLFRNKHIPKEYMINNRDTRLKVLAGLIDSDGCAPKDQNGKRIVIPLKHKRLFDDMVLLSRSLGFVVNVNKVEHKNETCMGYGPKDYPDSYILNLSGEFLHEIPTILPRKKCVGTLSNKDYFRTSIEVKPIGKGKYFGWQVDNNHRFVGSDFTVLRNCNQMWCVECNTPWDWKTGRIETGTIHNPEYFDWLKKQNGSVPRNPLDIICGREIDSNFIQHLHQIFPRTMAKNWQQSTRGDYFHNKTHERSSAYPFKEGTKSDDNFVEIARNIIHIRHVEVPRFQEPVRLQDNLQMRIDFMRNKIEKEDYKRKIQKKEKENEKKREINNVLGMYTNCMTDIFYRLVDKPSQKNIIKNEMEELRKYSNESLTRIGTTFNCKKYEINKDFVFC